MSRISVPRDYPAAQPAPTRAFSLPAPETITRQELDNGVIVLARENPMAPSVVVQGYLWAGATDVSAEQAGLAAFAAECLTRGTVHRTFAEINEDVESIGATLGTDSSFHTTSFSVKCLAEDLDHMLEILADVIQTPTFPPDEVEKVRGEWLTGLEQRESSTRSMAGLTFRSLAYPEDHPYARSTDGYRETIEAIGRDDLVAFRDDHYGPRNMAVSVVGAVTPEEAVEKIGDAFGDWEGVDREVTPSMPEAPPLEEIRRGVVTIPGKSQVDLVGGVPALSRQHPDFVPASMANTILGVFGMMGRLGTSVRDEQGLAYYVYSRLSATLGPAPWRFAAGVNPQNVERALAGILAEIRRLRDEPVEEEELADVKNYLTGSLPLRLETNEGVSQTLLHMELFDLGLDYLEKYPDLIGAVTVEDVQRVAQKYLSPEAYAVGIAGAYEEDE